MASLTRDAHITHAKRQLAPQASPTPGREAPRGTVRLDSSPRAAQIRGLQTLADASGRTAQLRDLQALADASPRAAPQRDLRALARARPPAAVIQGVGFAPPGAQNFGPQQFEPRDLPPALNAALADQYDGVTAERVFSIPVPDGTSDWLRNQAAAETSSTVHVHVRAKDWQGLGRTNLAVIETAAMSQTFFDQQHQLVGRLRDVIYAAEAQGNPGRPIRVASFKFQRQDDGALTTALVQKAVEPGISEDISDNPLLNLGDHEEVRNARAEVRANVNQTLFSAGQFQWIAAHWDSLSATHDVFIDVDFYPDRMASASGLHKDSVGETLFVNLTYDNAEAIQGAEYLADNTSQVQAGMPQAADELVLGARAHNAQAPDIIETQDLPARARTSFIDPAMWHSTPVYGRRPPEPTYRDDEVKTIAAIYQDIESNLEETLRGPARDAVDKLVNTMPLNDTYPTVEDAWNYAHTLDETQKQAAIAELKQTIATKTVTGGELKQGIRNVTPYRATRHNTPQGAAVYTPLDHKQRRKSMELQQHPERNEALRAQASQPRTFIRTWIILKPRVG